MIPLLLYQIYAVVSWILFIYAVNFYYLIYRSFYDERKPGEVKLQSLPYVTIQLPLFNERYVALRLIKAVCSLNYPKGRMQIQVLDDSTDETRSICMGAVEYYRAQGFNIEYLARKKRIGFKAGALQYGLKRAKGEYIAIFDADFVPLKEFLLRSLPYFSREDIGLVQARWGHLNEDYSTLTSAQALSLDLHFLVEQRARSFSELFMNFNGTAGVWRRSCIEDSGGWQYTLAEDLDLSYRAQLKGWKFIFLSNVVCPAELPVQINASKRQQFRWAKGAAQCALKFSHDLLVSSIPVKTKVQGLLQLTRHIVHPLVIIQFLLIPILLYLKFNLFLMTAFLSHLLLGPVVYLYTIRQIWKDGWLTKVGHYFFMILFSLGMCVNNTKAVIEGFTGIDSEFARTPKFAVVRKTDGWRRKKYVLPFTRETLVELFLAFYGVYAIFVSLFTKSFIVIPYLCLATLGFLYVSLLTISHSLKAG